MSDLWFFVLGSITMVLLITAYIIPPSKWFGYFSSEDGLGILKGIVIVVVVGAVVTTCTTVTAGEPNYFEKGEVFLGLDHTKKQSPMCESNQVDDQWTSNVGARVSIVRINRAELLLKYTHHSCMLGVDDRSYDAIGLEWTWRVW